MGGGLGNLFKKIIPIIMLVCFICLGITHTFGRFQATETNGVSESNISYISKVDANSETNPNAMSYYTLDVNNYLSNIDFDILKRATNHVIDTETLQDNLRTFNLIWENGYQIGDVSDTIINGILLIINLISTAINLCILPVRIIAGILLTGFALVGIKTNTNGIIINGLNALLDVTAIPLINPTIQQEVTNSLTNTTWKFKNLQIANDLSNITINVIFYYTYNLSTQKYAGIRIDKDNTIIKLYGIREDLMTEDLIYDDGAYTNHEQIFYINNDNRNLTEQEIDTITAQLNTIATLQE